MVLELDTLANIGLELDPASLRRALAISTVHS